MQSVEGGYGETQKSNVRPWRSVFPHPLAIPRAGFKLKGVR